MSGNKDLEGDTSANAEARAATPSGRSQQAVSGKTGIAIAGHTPGPYAYQRDRTIHDAAGTPLARCYADRNEDANGPLFAAAPQLLDMLEMFVDAAKPRGPDGHHDMPRFSATEISLARAAIAKARS